MLAAGLTLTGCKAKKTDAPATGSAGAPAGSTSAGSAPATAAPATAAGGAVQDLPIVTDCPKSLGGTEKVARTIKKACGPITVTETLVIDGSLTLEAGVVLKFQPDTELVVGYHGAAKLIIQGGDAPDQRVLLTSAGDQAAGVWKGISLDEGADRSQITGLDLEYAGAPDGAALRLHDVTDVTLTKSTIKHAKTHGIATRGKVTFAQCAGNELDDVGKLAISVEPSTVGSLGSGHKLGPDAVIEIREGTVDSDATWPNLGVPYQISATVYVESQGAMALTIAGATLVFATDAELIVGYHARGKLKITGPAVLTSIDGKPGTWRGLRIDDRGEATIEGATFSSGGSADSGVLTVKRSGKVTLGEVTFKDNTRGLWVDDQGGLTAPKPLTFRGNERAAHLSATGLGALTAANVYDDGQIIEIVGGELRADTTWLTQAKAAVQVLDDVMVEGGFTLTISAGGTYLWKPGTGVTVGYHGPGSLKIAGRADAPVVLGTQVKGEPWKGIDLDTSARSTELAHVQLADVGGEAGVIAKNGAAGKLDHVSCARCAATVAPACGAKLDTSAAVTAGAETKVAIVKPTGC